MRLYDLTRGDVARVVIAPERRDRDERGNARLVGRVGARTICVIVATDDPGLIITVYETRS